MQETFERLIFYARDVWRYRWLAILLACVLILAGWIVISFKAPIIYTASAKVYVDTSTVLQPLLKGLSVDKDPEAYLGLMTRELVSRPILEQVANEVGFNIQLKSPQEISPFLTNLERNIEVTASSAIEGARQRDFYAISYSSQDPKFATQIVDILIKTFVDKIVAESVRDSGAARQFLEQQIQEKQQEMNAAEALIAKFKSEHVNELPEEGVNYFQRLQADQNALENVELQITEVQNKKQELKRQLALTPSSQRALSADGKPILTPTGTRLQELNTRLDELLLKYTDKHPDVIATRRSIAALENQVSAETQPVIPNPVHQQLQVTLSEIDAEIAALYARKNEFQQRVQKLREQTETLTEVEASLQRLYQNYDRAKQQYDTLVARQGTAAMAENVEQAGEDVRFRIVDPPRVIDVEQNIIRKRLLLTSAILAAGLGGGVAAAFLLSQVWPVVYRRRTVTELAGVPVIGTISQVPFPRLQLRKYFEIAGIMLIGIVIVAAHGFAVWYHIGNISRAFQAAGSIG